MTRNARNSLSILMALSTFACGGGGGDVDAGAGMDDGGPVVDAAPATDAGRRDAGPAGNDSFETATVVETDTNPGAAETINPAGESDYFRFEGTAGDWVAVFTLTEAAADGTQADTVITLYDSTMTQIAENDDAQPRTGTDSELILRLPSTGTYYYKVQEFSTWAPDMVMGGPVGGRAYAYETSVITLTSASTGVLIDGEPGNDAASATALPTGRDSAFVLGRFDTATDVDVFSLQIPATTAAPKIFDVEVMPAGPMGYGATRSAGRVWVTDAMGTIIARSTIGTGITGVQPSFATTGEIRIFVEAPSGAAGTNDHYVLKVFTNDENPLEGAAPNETLATAEARALAPVMGGMGESSFVLARLPAGDVDYFALEVMAGRRLSVACGSRRDGSGVLGLTAEVRNAMDMVLTSSTESATEDLFIDGFAVPAAGTYYIRLAGTGQDPEVTGDWVRCGIRAL